MRIQVERTLMAPSDRVWAAITDVERSSEVLSSVQAVERTDDGDGFGVGTRWRETRLALGRQATEELRVTAVDPGRSYTVEVDGRGSHSVSTLAVEPLDDQRCRVSMIIDITPSGIVARLMGVTIGQLLRRPIRQGLLQDLEDLAKAVEHRT